MFDTFAHGKFLLTGEYVVLDGALALALPLKKGQHLQVEPWNEPGDILWQSIDHLGKVWFSGKFNILQKQFAETDQPAVAERLQTALSLLGLAPDFSAKITIRADFPLQWGLGSSSTLIAALAQWKNINPYPLQAAVFGGSGYDIACAYSNSPITYRLKPDLPPGEREIVTPVYFHPEFRNALYFIYLGKKQDSRAAIQHYRQANDLQRQDTALKISQLTQTILNTSDLSKFEELLSEHEAVMASILQLPPVKQSQFQDFPGQVKSLGAWGGDFVLATSPWQKKDTLDWFAQKGYPTVLGWDELCLVWS